jgi:hypothetical protein
MQFLGGSCSGSADSAAALLESGASHVRVYLLWAFVQERVESPLENITVAELQKNPSLIADWAKTVNWDNLDRRISYYSNTSVKVIGEVGEGTVFGLPRFENDFFDPNVVGTSTYLAYVYRASRATVARYKSHVHMWQIENELNEAWLESILGQRRFQFTKSVWRDWQFLTQLLVTLKAAVKDEEATALVTTNLHTDVAKWVHEVLFLKGYFEEAASLWVRRFPCKKEGKKPLQK